MRQRVGEGTETIDADRDGVAGLHGADAGWGSGRDEVAGLEGHEGRDVAEEFRNGKDEVGGRAGLAQLAVEVRGEGDGGGDGVELVGNDGAGGAEGVPALASGPLAVGFLDVAGGDVVDEGVAADVIVGVVGWGEVAAGASDDDRELAFEVDAF